MSVLFDDLHLYECISQKILHKVIHFKYERKRSGGGAKKFEFIPKTIFYFALLPLIINAFNPSLTLIKFWNTLVLKFKLVEAEIYSKLDREAIKLNF